MVAKVTPLTTACSRRPSQSSNLRTQICRLSGARLMLAVRRHCDVAVSSRVHRPRFPQVPGAVVRTPRSVPPFGSTVWKCSSHAPLNVILRARCHRPKVAAAVLQRQWPCTMTSLLIVVAMEMFAGACHAIRCAEPSLGRSFSREVIVVTVWEASRLFLSKVTPNPSLDHQTVIKFACANLPPLCWAAQLRC